MRTRAFALALAATCSICAAAEVRFATQPTAKKVGDKVTISFAASQATDVSVAIVNSDGATVRHLAAGVLGDAAPAPLKPGSLAQAIVWDGADDAGKPAPAGDYKAVVRLGLTAKFDRLFGDEKQRIGAVNAIVTGPKGEVYIYDGGQIIVLDRQGKYLRQIMPFPPDMSHSKLAGLDPVVLADGTLFLRHPYPDAKWVGSAIGSMAISPDGRMLYLPGPPRYARKLTRIGTDGSVPAGAFDTRLTTHADNGFLHLACSPDGKTLYMAGHEAGYLGDDARELSYRQSVYRLRLDSTGPAENFTGDDENSGRPGFSVSRPKGLACDAKGNLYVCNYGRGDVAVHTPGAGFLRAIPVKHPHQVAVHPKTGQLYVLAGRQTGRYKYGYHYPPVMHEAKLVRFSADGKVELELEIEPPFLKRRKDAKTGQFAMKPEFRLRMAVDFSEPAKPVVWIGLAYPSPSYSKFGLLRIEDLGKKFGQPRDVCVTGPTTLRGSLTRMALDRERDILYLASGGKFARYTGDGKLMESLRLTDKSGQPFKGRVAEPAVGPEGMIYFSSLGSSYRDNFLARATPDGKIKPFEAGRPKVSHILKGGGGSSSRGFTVNARGEMFVLYYDDANRPPDKTPAEPWDKCMPLPTALAKFAPDGRPANMHLVYHLRRGAQCVRIDSKGNIYVADNFMPSGVTYPPDIAKVTEDPLKRPYPARLNDASFDPMLRWMGCVLKFGPEGGQVVGLPAGRTYRPVAKAADLYRPAPQVQWFMFNYHHLKVTGALWQFHGIAPIPAHYQGVTHVERCVCSGARFDLDPFDRVYVPDTFRHRITVLDSNGNAICRFGQYGNRDSVGPQIGLLNGGWVAAAADRVYIGDQGLNRVVKVRLGSVARAACDVKR